MIGFNGDSLIQTLSHENAHANKAIQLGADFNGYKFSITKDIDGGYLVMPAVVVSIPEEWDRRKKKNVDIQVIRAPDEYGHEMSQADKNELRIKYGI